MFHCHVGLPKGTVSLFFESLAVVTWKLLRFERPFWWEKGRVEVEGKRPIVCMKIDYFTLYDRTYQYTEI